MTRREFETLAGIGKTTFFGLVNNPQTRAELEYRGGVTGTVEDNLYDASTDRITVRIPAAGTRLFARMRVTVP